MDAAGAIVVVCEAEAMGTTVSVHRCRAGHFHPTSRQVKWCNEHREREVDAAVREGARRHGMSPKIFAAWIEYAGEELASWLDGWSPLTQHIRDAWRDQHA